MSPANRSGNAGITVADERNILLDVAQLVAHLVRDQEVAGSSPVIQTRRRLSEFWQASFASEMAGQGRL